MDRIQSEKFSSLSISGESSFNPKTHFKDVIGIAVTLADPKQEIILKVQKNRDMETKKWHHSRVKINEDEDSQTFSLNLVPNREFWAKIMEHLEDLDILEPTSLRDELRIRVRTIWERLRP